MADSLTLDQLDDLEIRTKSIEQTLLPLVKQSPGPATCSQESAVAAAAGTGQHREANGVLESYDVDKKEKLFTLKD
ncbi:hypothetical protein V9T40_005249 [Parthenolecanium corni]|uniref:Uncharacterized protein n=1 Tax=Parthenolecanium corni TaxID=536013 RepID=A0AAN9TUN6_9HEMI